LPKERKSASLEGQRCILEMPIHADYALIKAHKADELGNLTYRLAARNFNPIIGHGRKDNPSQKWKKIVPVGTINPETCDDPGDLCSSHRASEKDSVYAG